MMMSFKMKIFHDSCGSFLEKVSFYTFCIDHNPISSAAKTIKPQACSETNPTALPRTLKMDPAELPAIASNTATSFPASLLKASAGLFSYFFRDHSSFGEDELEVSGRPPPPKIPLIASEIVEMVRERAASIDIIVIPYYPYLTRSS